MMNYAHDQMKNMLAQAEAQVETIRRAMVQAGAPVTVGSLESKIAELEKRVDTMTAKAPTGFQATQIVPDGPAAPVTTNEMPSTVPPEAPKLPALPIWMLVANQIAQASLEPEQCEWLGKHIAEGYPGFSQFLQSQAVQPLIRTFFTTYTDFLSGKVK